VLGEDGWLVLVVVGKGLLGKVAEEGREEAEVSGEVGVG